MLRITVALVVIVGVSACAKAENRIGGFENRLAELEQEMREHSKRDGKTNEELAALREELEAMKVQLAHVHLVTRIEEVHRIGIRVCDDYIADYTRCIDEKVPEAAREQMFAAMEQTRKAWMEAASGPAKDRLPTACRAAADAAKQATLEMGCVFSSP
jgi:hypothetical protein